MSVISATSHGARPRVTVTVDHDYVHDDTDGVGVTEGGLVVSGSAVRRMA